MRVLGLGRGPRRATLALAHDLGHTPFGHAGETALDRCMEGFGGFDHNAQTLRIVTKLERRYARFDGLNLTWETLEGLVKHNGPVVTPKRGIAALPRALAEYAETQDLELSTYAGPEAQVAAPADDIAYNNHDVDDGLQRVALCTLEDLAERCPWSAPLLARRAHGSPGPETDARMVRIEAVRRLIGAMVERFAGRDGGAGSPTARPESGRRCPGDGPAAGGLRRHDARAQCGAENLSDAAHVSPAITVSTVR